MDLLLTHGYFLAEDPKEALIMKPYAPLGILYLSSHLRQKGFDVEIYDSTFGSREELQRILETETPATIGIYSTLMTRASVMEIAEAAGELDWTVVMGGPEPENYPGEYLATGVDFVVAGEGERTMEDLLQAQRDYRYRPLGLLSVEEAAKIQGLHYLGEDGAMFSGPRELMPDLDAQPWPDRERIDIDKYLTAWRERHGQGSVSVITARGCPYHCRWCSHSTYGKTHRRHSASNVADEVEWILDRYKPEMLWMADDVFTIHHGWIFEYAAELKRREVHVPFECITRADQLDAKVADALAEMGCFRVWIGSESGSQRILDAMERGVKVEQVQESVRLCRERGIETGMFLMWGYEGEEPADIEATVDHVKTCDPNVFLTTVSYPIKGTPYHDEVSERLVNLAEWEKTSDRESKIAGRHSRRYYDFADQWLKSEVKLQQLSRTNGTPDDEAELSKLKSQIAGAKQGLADTADEVEA